MKNGWKILASYGRVVLVTVLTAVSTMGHVPSTKEDLILIAKAAALALLPVILRALNPNDPAYGIGSK